MEPRGTAWFLVGFLMLAGGNAVGAVYMFRGDVPVVMAGVLAMVAGYHVMHYGVHREGMVNRPSTHTSNTATLGTVRDWAWTVVLLLASVFFIAQGFVIGSQATREPLTLLDMCSCGAFIVGGYVTGHMAVHQQPL